MVDAVMSACLVMPWHDGGLSSVIHQKYGSSSFQMYDGDLLNFYMREEAVCNPDRIIHASSMDCYMAYFAIGQTQNISQWKAVA